MKKSLITVVILGLLITGTYVFAKDIESKGIAIVDVQQVVMNSAKVKKLETERLKQEKDLQTFVMNAKKSIEAEQDETKKKNLQEKLNKELSQKINAQRKEVTQKTIDIEKEILSAVEKYAKEEGYEVIIPKSAVLYGGKDITDEIIKQVK